MAFKFRAADHPKAPESDYGSDFTFEEENIVIELLERLQDDQTGAAILEAVQRDPILQADLNAAIAADLFVSSPPDPLGHEDVSANLSGAKHILQAEAETTSDRARPLLERDVRSTIDVDYMPMDGIEYPDLSRALPKSGSSSALLGSQSKIERKDAAGDERSPVERFRSFPKKPLTVTDISSGAWCELQYWYTLTQLPGGRKTRTAAMKGGTKVHQTLEDQVYTTIQVNVSLKEEAFALRLWNLIQGLRTLRDKGLTRELEVWGLVEGQVVNGVIDELSYTSPNLGFEEELSQSQPSQDGTSKIAAKQLSITEYLDPHRRRIYITDVKTRGSTRLPSGAALRPSRVQLFLYHRLLGDMAAGRLDFATIITRYGLQTDVRFSDAFMAQIGSLHDEVFEGVEPSEVEPGNDAVPAPSKELTGMDGGYSDPPSVPGTDSNPASDLIRFRTIRQIIPLVQAELRETFPHGAETLGDLVAVIYRHREDGRIIGNQTFPTDTKALSNYLKLDLNWWLGKKNPDGVPIEEAYKCRMCEFAESCEWRRERNEEIVRKSRRQTNQGVQN